MVPAYGLRLGRLCDRRLLVGLCGLAALISTPEARATALPAGFEDQVVLDGIESPTALAFEPGSGTKVFVATKGGRVLVHDSLSDTTPTTFADLSTETYDSYDRGLLGLAVDPQFPARPYLYALYTRDAVPGGAAPRWNDACPDPPGANTSGCLASARLVKLTMGAGGVMTGVPQTLVDDWCQQFPSHSIGTVRFGADGMLYAGAGDAASYTTSDWGQLGGTGGVPKNPCGDPPTGSGGNQVLPNAEGGALRSQDLRTTSDPTTLDGTIIRVNPDTGAAAPGNPLIGASWADANARRAVASGLRNPYRFTLRPGTDEVWIGDVGNSGFEEVNRIADSTDGSVDNFGWPCYEGPGQSGWLNTSNICIGLYAASGAQTAPYFSYAHGSEIVPGDGCGTGSSAISGTAFYGSGTYPSGYDGGLFIADYARGCITFLPTGANGLPNPSTPQAFASGPMYPVDLQVGPGGDLYYVKVWGDAENLGGIHRITYSRTNASPTARITATPRTGSAPLAVQFDGTGSTDPDAGDSLWYAWDLDGDGAYDDSTSATPRYTYATEGSVVARLKVTDRFDASGTATKTISVANDAPVATIVTPSSGATWKVGDLIAFRGTGVDPQQGSLPGSAMDWRVVIHHCPSGCHEHQLGSFPDRAAGSFAAPDHEYPSTVELQLTVTDASGLTSTDTLVVAPATTTVTVASAPAGLLSVLNGAALTTPATRTVILGSQNTIGAAATQFPGGVEHRFVGWSDGGDATHTFAADVPAGTTRTATYDRRPVASFTAGPTSVPTGSAVTFDGAASSDPDPGDALTFAWDLDGDGSFETDSGTNPTVSRSYAREAAIDVGLQVTDAHGWSAQTTRPVAVTSAIVAPAIGTPLPAAERNAIKPERPAGANRRDRIRPTLSFLATASRRPDRALRGVARDAGGVRSVQLALRTRRGSSGACRWWSARLRGLGPPVEDCGSPRWITVRTGRPTSTRLTWSLALGSRLAPGTYVVAGQARDHAGNVGRRSVTFVAR